MCDFISKCVRPSGRCAALDMTGYDVPPCFVDVALLKTEPETGANVPLDRLVMPYAEYSNGHLELIARADSSTLCEYLRTETVFDADRIAGCLAMANIAAAEELKRRAKA